MYIVDIQHHPARFTPARFMQPCRDSIDSSFQVRAQNAHASNPAKLAAKKRHVIPHYPVTSLKFPVVRTRLAALPSNCSADLLGPRPLK
jgi:hypothetical protein